MKQTIKFKLKPTIEQEKHLHNICSIATKLYNTDNHIRREEWDKTGKIPNVYTQKKLLKNNVWFKLLPSQSAQEVIFTLQQNYNSWFSKRKTDKTAKPPMFRKKVMLSPISFYQQFKITGNKIRLSMSRKYSSENKIRFMEIEFEKWKEIEGIQKNCQIIFRKGEWFVHVVSEVEEPQIIPNENIMSIDLGIINTGVTFDTNGNSIIYTGRGILEIQHYFNSRIARVQSKLNKQFPNRHTSRTLNNLYRKKKAQIDQSLHIISKNIVEQTKQNNIKTIVVGDIKNIRKDKKWNKKSSQKLHSWSFSKLTRMIRYKGILSGIRFDSVSEKNTSKTCSFCGMDRKSNRIHRGLYKCKNCGQVINSDLNSTRNILKKYLQINNIDRSIGSVAQPLVSRIENVKPR